MSHRETRPIPIVFSTAEAEEMRMACYTWLSHLENSDRERDVKNREESAESALAKLIIALNERRGAKE